MISKLTLTMRTTHSKKSYEGPSSASISASSIHLNRDDDQITLNNISGTAWPAPIVRLFTPKVAEHIETYRFHRPPNLIASGSFGLNGNKDATNFNININSPSSIHYTFIGEPLTLSRLQSNVQILGDRVDVNNLSFNTFEGPCSGNIRSLHITLRKNQVILETFSFVDSTSKKLAIYMSSTTPSVAY